MIEWKKLFVTSQVLTYLSFWEYRFFERHWFTQAFSILSHYSEGVSPAFKQFWNSIFSLSGTNTGYSDPLLSSCIPSLDGIAHNRCAAIRFWWGPLQGDRITLDVLDLQISWCGGHIFTKRKDRLQRLFLSHWLFSYLLGELWQNSRGMEIFVDEANESDIFWSSLSMVSILDDIICFLGRIFLFVSVEPCHKGFSDVQESNQKVTKYVIFVKKGRKSSNLIHQPLNDKGKQ